MASEATVGKVEAAHFKNTKRLQRKHCGEGVILRSLWRRITSLFPMSHLGAWTREELVPF